MERKLNKVPGVTAAVNYATEKAWVTFEDPVSTDDLIATVESAGYGARLPAAAEEPVEPGEDPELRAMRQRLVVSAVLTVPVVLLAMDFAGRNGQRNCIEDEPSVFHDRL